MSKILFVNGNLHGHINPTLPIVKELVRRGEEVYYFGTKEFEPKLTAAGAVFLDYGPEFDLFLREFHPHGNHPFYTLMEYMLGFDRTIVPVVLKKVQGIRFDCIIHDVMFGGGSILADQLHLPAIASCSSFVMQKLPLPERMLEPGFHPQLDYLYGLLTDALVEWGKKDLQLADIFYKKAPLTLVYTSRMFHPMGSVFGDAFCFVGPSVTDRNETLDFKTDPNKKLVYISMGTILSGCEDFYNKCIDAFSDENYQVIISIGKKTDITQLKPAPEHILLRDYIPQLEVLKKADVFISHGGLNSVSEALYYGVPVIPIPLSNDQPAVAKQLAELGAGIELKMEEVTKELLSQTVHTVLGDQSYQKQSQVIGDSFRKAGGYQKAADIILDYIP